MGIWRGSPTGSSQVALRKPRLCTSYSHDKGIPRGCCLPYPGLRPVCHNESQTWHTGPSTLLSFLILNPVSPELLQQANYCGCGCNRLIPIVKVTVSVGWVKDDSKDQFRRHEMKIVLIKVELGLVSPLLSKADNPLKRTQLPRMVTELGGID